MSDTLKTKIPLNFETQSSYTIQITTDDGRSGTFEKEFEITILNVNDAPTAITLSNNTINENMPIETLIGTLTTMDEDDPLGNGTYTYTLGDTHKDTFEILGNELKTKIPLNFETQSSYTIQITTDDGQGGIYNTTFVISVKDVNDAPTAITLSNDTIDENSAVGTVIGILNTIDPDDIDNDNEYNYTINGTPADTFQIVEDTLKTKIPLNYEAQSSYTIQITTNDGRSGTFEKEFEITILNVNDVPTAITLSNDTINENSAVGTLIGILSTIDPDDIGNDNEYNYTINGPPSDTFQIVSDTLKTKIPLNYEEQSGYVIQITTDDGQGGIYDTTFVISVKDVNDAPTRIDITNNQLPENVPMETLVGTLTTMDEDDTLHTYVLGDGEDDALFIIQIVGDTLKTKIFLNHEIKLSYAISITTQDNGGNSLTEDFIITIDNTNDAPTDITLSYDTINENSAVGTIIGILNTIDPDDIGNDNEYNYTINGTPADTFQIVEDTLKTKIPLNYEEKSSYTIQITTNDGQGVEHLKTELLKSPSLKDVNDVPTAISLSNNTINENVAHRNSNRYTHYYG